MQDFREYFLGQFDRQIATGIIEFGKKLSNTEADIFLLMARKAACFVECLEELSLVKLQGHVVTDRVLDMDTSWLKDKDVVIVDDAIVSGTTVHDVIQILTEAGARGIRVVVMCTNTDWFVPELLLNADGKSYIEEPYMRLRNNECIQLCSDIVTALSIFPRPYSVDFPLYKNTRIPEPVFEEVLTHFLWESDDISTALQSENDIVSTTLTPSKTFIGNLDALLGLQFSKFTICKIRLYGKCIENPRLPYAKNRRRHNRSSRRVYNLKVLPIVILKPIRREDIDSMFEALAGSFPDSGELLVSNFTSPQSRLRLIQHVVANYLGRFWIDTISHLTTSKISLLQDDRSLSFLYPFHLIPIIQDILGQNQPIFNAAVYNPADVPFDPQPEYKTKIQGDDLLSITAKLSEPFLHLYNDKELKSRQLVKECGKKVFKNPQYRSIVTRLKKGFPITFLEKLIRVTPEKYDYSKMVSLFLDRSIDLGIVVPITGEKDGIFFRAYRHGEDVIFGEVEEKLVSVMLQSFLESSGRENLTHFWTEKLLVLLIKIGVQKKFLKEFIYDNPPKEVVRILSVKNYLFGQVVKEQVLEPTQSVVEPVYLNEDQKSQWLTNIMVEKRMLSRIQVNGKARYKLNDIDTSDFKLGIRFESEIIGDIFGRLYANREERISPFIVDNDLVLLTSCLNPNDISASMAAEIFIFKNKWPNYRSFVNSQVIKDEKLYEVARSVRHESILWTAVNSGQKKFRDFKDKTGHKLIADIGEQFSEKLYNRNWMQFWSANLEWDESSVSEQLKELIDIQAAWLFRVNIYLRCLELLLRRLMDLNGMGAKVLSKKEADLGAAKDRLTKARLKVKTLKEEKVIDQAKLNQAEYQLGLAQNYLRSTSEEIEEILHSRQSIMNEINEKIANIGTYNLNDDEPVNFVHSVYKAVAIEDLQTFQGKKMVNQTMRRLEDCFQQTKLLLERVDLIVTPFGKVEQSFDYPHALYIQVDSKDDKQKQYFENYISNELLEFEKETFRFKDKPGIGSFFLLPSHKNPSGKSFIILGRGVFAKSRLVTFGIRLFESWHFDKPLKLVFIPSMPVECSFNIQVKNNNNIKSGFFFDRFFSATADINDNYSFYVLSLTGKLSSEVVEDVVRDANGYFENAYIENNVKENKNAFMGLSLAKEKKGVDIGIITIVPPELNAIKEILKNRTDGIGVKTVRHYHKGFLEGANGIQHEVVVTQQLIQGNESVISAYADLVDEHHPKLMILFGIAGSISDDHKLCDVCIVNEVIAYDRRKEKDKVYRRGSTYRVSAKLAAFVNAFFSKFGEKPRLQAALGSLAEDFLVDAGPLGSGNAVVGNPLSEIKKWLLEFNDKTIAVETEAVGFANANWEEDLKRVNDKIGALVIRGISDHANFDKDDKWRITASQNAATVVVEFVKLLPRIDTLIS